MNLFNRTIRWLYKKGWRYLKDSNLGNVWKVFSFDSAIARKDIFDILDASGLDSRNVSDVQIHELPSGGSYLQIRIWFNDKPSAREEVLNALARKKDEVQKYFNANF